MRPTALTRQPQDPKNAAALLLTLQPIGRRLPICRLLEPKSFHPVDFTFPQVDFEPTCP
jgi:hypothetical protein